MPLSRQVQIKDNDKGEVFVNVYDINTKAVVFNGNQCGAAAFLSITQGHLGAALRKKCRIKKQFAVRIAKQPATS